MSVWRAVTQACNNETSSAARTRAGKHTRRHTTGIPRHGATSTSDGQAVIFLYIDLNVQTLQNSAAARGGSSSLAAAAAGGIGHHHAASSTATPGRLGAAAYGSSSMRPAGVMGAAVAPAAPAAIMSTPGGGAGAGVRHGGGVLSNEVMAKLSGAFQHWSASLANSSEKVRGRLSVSSCSRRSPEPDSKAFQGWTHALPPPHVTPTDVPPAAASAAACAAVLSVPR
jgi:hypothetical protein